MDFAFPESSCARVRMEKVEYTGFWVYIHAFKALTMREHLGMETQFQNSYTFIPIHIPFNLFFLLHILYPFYAIVGLSPF